MRYVCQDCDTRYTTENETPEPDPECPKCGGSLSLVEQEPARNDAIAWLVGAVVTLIGVTFLLAFFVPKLSHRPRSERASVSTTKVAKRPPKRTRKRARKRAPPKPVADETYAPPGLLADDEPDIVAGGSLQSRLPSGDGSVQLAYRWEDPHSVRIKRWSGDTPTIDRSGLSVLALTTAVDRNHMRRVAASFGLPNSWSTLSYRNNADLERKKRARERRLVDRGIVSKDNRLSVDHKWVVEKSKGDMKIPMKMKE